MTNPELEALLRVPSPDPPSDFEEFWRATYAEVRQIPLQTEMRRVASADPNYELYEVEFDSLGQVRSGGWISMPADGNFARGVVAGHGYGGRNEPEPAIPGPPAVTIFPCARGFNRSMDPRFPDVGSSHVLHGIGNRETYIHRGCAAEIWSAASVLLEQFPAAALSLHYFGASFGGGIGALAIPWDARFHRVYLDVPSFGNHPARVRIPCAGSGESVRLHFEKQPEVLETLAYFDSATAAQFIRIPAFVSAALSDPAVPPEGQFAVYNALPGPKELFVRSTGHPNVASEDEALFHQLADWANRDQNSGTGLSFSRCHGIVMTGRHLTDATWRGGVQ